MARDFEHTHSFDVGPRRFDLRVTAPGKDGRLSDRHLSGFMKVMMYVELRLLIPGRALDTREIVEIREHAQNYSGCKGEILVMLTERDASA